MIGKKSIKRTVVIRTVAALISILLFSFVTTANIMRIQSVQNANTQAAALLQRAERELGEYFAGRRRDFTLPLAPAGTPFQQAVWEALRRIPYGRTCCYRDIARAIGRPAACRAVGMANNRNPIVVVIPCHRVVGADGSLTGYAGGLSVKARLLEIEQGLSNKSDY